jgi:hypothetical protein
MHWIEVLEVALMTFEPHSNVFRLSPDIDEVSDLQDRLTYGVSS